MATNPYAAGPFDNDPFISNFFGANFPPNAGQQQQRQHVQMTRSSENIPIGIPIGGGNACKLAVTGYLGCCAFPIAIALLVIGCCAAAGVLTGVVTGSCFVALSIPLLLLTLLVGRKPLGRDKTSNFIIGIITNLARIALGALAIAGVIPPTTAGYVFLGIEALNLVYACIDCWCCGGMGQMMQIVNRM